MKLQQTGHLGVLSQLGGCPLVDVTVTSGLAGYLSQRQNAASVEICAQTEAHPTVHGVHSPCFSLVLACLYQAVVRTGRQHMG